MHCNRALVPILLAAFAARAPAQTTWIVDAAGGPGSHFTSLAPAFAAAVDGDTVRVRAGIYMPATIAGKGLTVLGAPGASLGDFFLGTPLRIEGLAFGQRVRIAGFDSITANQFTALVPALVIDNVAGSVHVQEVGTLRIVRIANCALATFTSCGLTSLAVDSSTVALSACTVTALNGQQAGSVTPPAAIDARTSSARAHVHLMRCSVTGASGVALPPFLVFANSPAITVTDGDLTIAGDALDTISAGTPLPGQPARAAITGSASSQLRLDPDVVLVPNPGAPPIAGPTLVSGRVVACTATGGELGGILELTTISPANEFVVVLLGLPGPESPTIHGSLWLLPVEIFLWTVQDASEHWVLPIPLPLFTPLTGLPLSFQAVAGNSGVVLSGPTTVILR